MSKTLEELQRMAESGLDPGSPEHWEFLRGIDEIMQEIIRTNE